MNSSDKMIALDDDGFSPNAVSTYKEEVEVEDKNETNETVDDSDSNITNEDSDNSEIIPEAYFTIYDFVGASENFKDPTWDGEPEPPITGEPRDPRKPKDPPIIVDPPEPGPEPRQITTIKLVMVFLMYPAAFNAHLKALRLFISKESATLIDIFMQKLFVFRYWGNKQIFIFHKRGWAD